MARPKKENVTSPFMDELKTKLKDKYSEGTANLYLSKLRILNKDAPFSSLTFLKNHNKIITAIENIENLNTRKSYVTACVGVLSAVDNATYNKINTHYKASLNKFKVQSNAIDTTKKTNTQEKNWIDWKGVLSIYDKLEAAADKVTQKEIDNNNKSAIDAIEKHVLLALYVLTPPRRNLDYYNMVVGGGDETDRNYYDGEKFTYNTYKTARSRGAEVFDVPEKLCDVLDRYIEMMDIKDGQFLLYSNGTRSPLAITRDLNRIFGKAIGSSMLRHIWNSHLFGDVIDKIKDNADKLGHSVGMDLGYVKT